MHTIHQFRIDACASVFIDHRLWVAFSEQSIGAAVLGCGGLSVAAQSR